MIALRFVVFEKLAREKLQALHCGMGATRPLLNGGTAAIKILPIPRHVLMDRIRLKTSRPSPRMLDRNIFVGNKIMRQKTVEARTNSVGTILCLLDELRWHNNVRIDS